MFRTGLTTIVISRPGIGNSVYDNIFNNPDLSIFREAIDAAGLAGTLDNEEEVFTVFAPMNAAFTVFALSNLGVDLTPIVENHVSLGLRSISDLSIVESEFTEVQIGDVVGNDGNGEPIFATADDVRFGFAITGRADS